MTQNNEQEILLLCMIIVSIEVHTICTHTHFMNLQVWPGYYVDLWRCKMLRCWRYEEPPQWDKYYIPTG